MSKRNKYFNYTIEFIMFFIAFMIGYYLELPKIYSLIISVLIYFFELLCLKIVKKIILKLYNKHHKKNI